MELTFTREDIPKITRAGGSGREAEPWENHLAPLKDSPEESFRVWTYDKRTSAVSRMSSVRERLVKAVPSENWQLAVRPLPGMETLPESEQKFGVYVAYIGTFTDEEVAANAKAHAERSARVKAARAAAEAARAAEEPATVGGSPLESATPKERVQAARAKAGAAK
jgi:hypothetical protein